MSEWRAARDWGEEPPTDRQAELDRWVEAVAPIDEPRLRSQLEELLSLYLQDSGAWHMASDGSFHQQQLEGENQLVQQALIKRWRGGLMPQT